MTAGAAAASAAGPGSAPNDGGAAASPLEVLAQINDLDVRLDQITHHVRNLPERETRAGIEAELGVLASEAKALDAQIADLERQQRRHEDEVARIEAKRAHNSERLYDSHLTSPKEAEALTAEADALGRHQIQIEDQILELMEELEPLTGTRADLGQRQSAAAERMATVDAAIEAAESEAGSERDEVLEGRAALVASAEPALVSIYEDRRAAARGTPVLGRLIGLTCSACHLEVPSVDYERITNLDPSELAECPHCGALLVR
ncbi:zinc ribbon domain-containing protein [Candidatus Poriferisodalis sp.]|uniref:zinc ribbon domain-containing protein n=1 Tax=Candidatus Poriferisodalis sp. TaxID=3101277 RepID=UPI003B019AB3